MCHQPTGLGLPNMFPPLAGSDWVTAPGPERLIRIVLHGFQGPINSLSGALRNGRVFSSQTGFALTGDGGLLDADGAAFVIHAAADDMKTDPTGNSGARLVCGIFGKE